MSEERIRSEEDHEQEPLSAEELDVLSAGVEQVQKKTFSEEQKQK
jgi:hypothetical protein